MVIKNSNSQIVDVDLEYAKANFKSGDNLVFIHKDSEAITHGSFDRVSSVLYYWDNNPISTLSTTPSSVNINHISFISHRGADNNSYGRASKERLFLISSVYDGLVYELNKGDYLIVKQHGHHECVKIIDIPHVNTFELMITKGVRKNETIVGSDGVNFEITYAFPKSENAFSKMCFAYDLLYGIKS